MEEASDFRDPLKNAAVPDPTDLPSASDLADAPETDSLSDGNPAWARVNLRMAALLDRTIASYDCDKKLMFGSPVYFVHDLMWSGIKGDVVFLRLPSEQIQALKSCSPLVIDFEPRPDRILKEYAALPEPLMTDQSFFLPWLQCSYAYTLALPPRPIRPRRATRRKGQA